jgi:hypothetical protein
VAIVRPRRRQAREGVGRATAALGRARWSGWHRHGRSIGTPGPAVGWLGSLAGWRWPRVGTAMPSRWAGDGHSSGSRSLLVCSPSDARRHRHLLSVAAQGKSAGFGASVLAWRGRCAGRAKAGSLSRDPRGVAPPSLVVRLATVARRDRTPCRGLGEGHAPAFDGRRERICWLYIGAMKVLIRRSFAATLQRGSF